MLSDEIFYLWRLKLAPPKWSRNVEVFPIPEPLDKVSVGFSTSESLIFAALFLGSKNNLFNLVKIS